MLLLLPGYVSTTDQHDLAFSIMVNNYGVQASYIRHLVDKVCIALSESKIADDNSAAPAPVD